jgi:hypothetical protein
VQDHRWRDQLDAARVFVLERINRRLGKDEVRELQFGLAHEGALTPARPAFAPVELPLLEPDRVLGQSALDPALREALMRAAEAAQKKVGTPFRFSSE